MNLKDLVAKNKVVCGYGVGCEKDPVFEEQVKSRLSGLRNIIQQCFIDEGLNKDYDDETQLMMGTRFCSDSSVINRMNLVKKKGLKAHRGNLDDFILDALVDCMKADYWYEFEKNWG